MKKNLSFLVIATLSLSFFSSITLAADSDTASSQAKETNIIETLFNPRPLDQGCDTYPDCPPAEELQIQLETQAVYNASDETDDQE